MVEFFLPMIPPTVTHQEKAVRVRNGKPVFYEPPELRTARQKLTDALAGYRPEEPFRGPVELLTKWCFPASGGPFCLDGMWKITRPDTDNLNKLLKDCMTKTGFWEDDRIVCREIIEKFWADLPGIYIRVTELWT